MPDLAVLAVVGAGSFVLRASFLAIAGGGRVPVVAMRFLDQVKPAMFAAVIAAAVVGQGLVDIHHVAAIGTAGLIALRGGNLARVLAGGMAALHLAHLVL